MIVRAKRWLAPNALAPVVNRCRIICPASNTATNRHPAPVVTAATTWSKSVKMSANHWMWNRRSLLSMSTSVRNTPAEPVKPSQQRPFHRPSSTGGMAATGLLSWVLLNKFEDHLPLYRLEQIAARDGVTLSRSTLAEWVGRCGVAYSLWPSALPGTYDSGIVFMPMKRRCRSLTLAVAKPGRLICGPIDYVQAQQIENMHDFVELHRAFAIFQIANEACASLG